MSLESAYLLGRKQAIRDLIRVDTKDRPILVIQIEREGGTCTFKGVKPYESGEVEVLPTPIEGPLVPYLPSLLAKDRLRLGNLKDENKRKERIEKFRRAAEKKLGKLVRSARALMEGNNADQEEARHFGKRIVEALDGAKEEIASQIVEWAKKRSEVDGLVLACSVDGVLPLEIAKIDAYLEAEYGKRSGEHSGTKVDGKGTCAWCRQAGDVSARMDYWKPGNVDNPYAVPFGRKEDSYKVIPVCLGCHSRIKNGMDQLNQRYSVRPGGGVQVLYAPRLLSSEGKRDIAEDIQTFQIFWDEIRKQVEFGVQQASMRGTRVVSLRGSSTTVSDLAEELEGACLTFDVSWIRSENSADLILARAQDVVPTWLLKLAEITDWVNRKSGTWSALACLCKTEFALDGRHFWFLFKQPSKQKAAASKRPKTESIKTLNLPWEVAAEVLERRVRPFVEFLPDFFRGVEAYWRRLEEKERRDVFKNGSNAKILEWISLWHRFSYYIYLIQKEMAMSTTEEERSAPDSNADGKSSAMEEDSPSLDAVREADAARVFQTQAEKGVFLTGIALGMLAIYQAEDGKTMRVLDYPGDYRLDEKGYQDFLRRFWLKLKEYLYVEDFRTKKGQIIQAIMSAATERTGEGFQSLRPESVGFALLSGVLRANHYYQKDTKKSKGDRS